MNFLVIYATMIEWIIENWELYLLISSLPFLIIYPITKYLDKKADEKLVRELKNILLRDKEKSE